MARTTGYIVDESINGTWSEIGRLGKGSTSYLVNGLDSGTTYEFQVAAFKGTRTAWSKPKSATTRPGPPAVPSFTATPASATQINLTWTSVADATGYLVDEWFNYGWSLIGDLESSANSYSVEGLSPATTYILQVGHFNRQGTTWANRRVAQPWDLPPSAPSFTAKAISATEIDLSWQPVADATAYYVDELINGGWETINTTNGTSFAATGLSPATMYGFSVGAYNKSGTSWAASQSAQTLNPPNPTARLFKPMETYTNKLGAPMCWWIVT